ncbi:MAG TPA: hypothetical protein VIV61_05635 [Candidatus Ozemobacteraceae bacterium]
MLIEIFTDGRVLLDGQEMGPTYRAEHALYEYLTNPQKLNGHAPVAARKKAA